jgi:hypothetical protein
MWSKMYIGLHVKYPYFCQILMKLEFSRQSLEKYTNTKFRDNPSSGSRVVPCGRMDTVFAILRIAVKLRNTKFPRFHTCSQVKYKGNASDAHGLVRACLFVLCVIYLTASTSTALLQRLWQVNRIWARSTGRGKPKYSQKTLSHWHFVVPDGEFRTIFSNSVIVGILYLK